MRFRRVIILTAGVLLLAGIAASQRSNTPEARLRAAMDKETVDGDLKAAIDGYRQVIAQRGASREVVAQALLRLGMAREKQGDVEARKSYERVVREFADQPAVVQQARVRLANTENASTVQTIRQVCSGDTCNGLALSPDGRLLISLNGNSSVLIRDLATGQSKQLLTVPAGRRFCCSAFSPDGKRIVYTLAPTGPNPTDREVVVANADGGGVRTVYRGGTSEAWSHDGRRILATASGQPSMKVFWVTIADGTTESLRTGPGWENMDIFIVSPDGKYIAFSGNKAIDDAENVYLMASDGSGEIRISASPTYHEPVGWSPDGKYLLYGQYGSSTTLWSVPITEGRVQGPAVSFRQFDRQVAILVTPSGTLYYRGVSGSGDLYTASMDPASGKVTSIPAAVPTTRTGANGPSIWSPDSRRIAYLAVDPAETKELYVFSTDDGKDRRITTSVSLNNGLCWPSGGDSILVNTITGRRPDRFEPVRLDLATGESRPVFPGAPSFRLWNCSDTLVAAFIAGSIKVRNIQSGAETEVYRFKRNAAEFNKPMVSPDGRSIAFLESLDDVTSAVMTVPSSGGTARELVRVKAPAELQPIAGHTWSHDSRFVYFLKRADSRSPHQLYRVPAGGGAEESMGLQGSEFRGLDISPDGRRIVFTIGAFNRPEIWAMENFLPPSK